MQRKVIIISIGLACAAVLAGLFYFYKPVSSPMVRVTVYAREKDGSHIFDGAVLTAMRKSDRKIVAEQVADGDGRVIFNLAPDVYRFQPSPTKEKRVVGFLDADVQASQELTLLLVQVLPE